jgi:hypothetical protein
VGRTESAMDIRLITIEISSLSLFSEMVVKDEGLKQLLPNESRVGERGTMSMGVSERVGVCCRSVSVST